MHAQLHKCPTPVYLTFEPGNIFPWETSPAFLFSPSSPSTGSTGSVRTCNDAPSALAQPFPESLHWPIPTSQSQKGYLGRTSLSTRGSKLCSVTFKCPHICVLFPHLISYFHQWFLQAPLTITIPRQMVLTCVKMAAQHKLAGEQAASSWLLLYLLAVESSP